MTLKTKKTLCLMITMLSIVTIIGTVSYAYFTASGEVKEANVSGSTGVMTLRFADNDEGINATLNFGESITKRFTLENTGTVDAVVYMYWKDLINTYTNGSLTYTLLQSDREDGTYTELVSNKNVPVSKTASLKVLADDIAVPVGTIYYYRLIITLNYLDDVNQDDDVNASFNTYFGVDDNNNQPMYIAKELLSKSNPESVVNYTDGNTKEMYVLDHDELETTTEYNGTTYTHSATQVASWTNEERKDYRYIGSNPNNFIMFNDEVWRIIGVFTVETESGSKEQLIKIVRNDSIGGLPWDMRTEANQYGLNEWSTSTLHSLLNGEYLNTGTSFDYTYTDWNNAVQTVTIPKGLNETARNKIANVKWYLGGSKIYQNLRGPDYYAFERGETVYNDHTINIVQKIGLMYPSDYIYTYAKGVDNTCYNNGFNCNTSEGGIPKAGWLYNTTYQWFQSLDASTSRFVFVAHSLRFMGIGSANNSYGVRPAVYLKSEIQITGGDGSQGNPYTIE